MSAPTQGSWEKLMRVGKYLCRNPRMIIDYKWQDYEMDFQVYSDANWAGCIRSRKSTSGGVVARGQHLIKTWSRNQSTIALSSAESEFNATVKAAAEGLGMVAMADDFGETCKVRLHVDASAALGVIQRKGIGKIRHLHTGSLWLQEQQLRNTIAFCKIKGTLNPADIFTKYLSKECIEKNCELMGANVTDGRANQAAQLHALQRKLRQLKAGSKAQSRKREITSRKEKMQSSNGPSIDNIEHYVISAELDVMEAVEKEFQNWKKAQCRTEGISRSNGGAILVRRQGLRLA